MGRTKWLVDGRGIAMKVKNATHLSDFQKNGRSEANIICPNCNHKIDNSDLMGESLFCDEILENHSSDEKHGVENCVPSLPDCGRIQGDEIKNDLHHPADASPELANIELDTPPEVHMTDSLFSSQESISGWLTKNIDWLANDKSSTKPGENLGDSQCST